MKGFLNCLIENTSRDEELIDFYNTYCITGLTFDKYLEHFVNSNEDFFLNLNEREKKKFLLNYSKKKSRLKEKLSIGERIININTQGKKVTQRTIIPLLEFELKKIAISNYSTEDNKIVRLRSMVNMYKGVKASEVFIGDKPVDINNRKAYVSKDTNTSKNEMESRTQFLFDSDDIKKEILIEKGNTFIKVGALDFVDQAIVDYLIKDYSKVMYSGQFELIYPLSDISYAIYNGYDDSRVDKIQERLIKLASFGQIIHMNNDSEALIKNIDKDNLKIVSFFDLELFTKDNVKYCKILISRSIEADLKAKNTLEFNEEKIAKIKIPYTRLLVNYIQVKRIDAYKDNKLEATIPYRLLMISIIPPRGRRKKENIIEIRKSLQELKDLGLMISDFELNEDYLRLEFIEFSYLELKSMNLPINESVLIVE